MADYNNNGRIQISTGLTSFFGENQRLLKISAMDTSISLAFCEPAEVNGKTTYPKEQRHIAMITYDRAMALYQQIVDYLLPSYKEGRADSVGCYTNMDRSGRITISVDEDQQFRLNFVRKTGDIEYMNEFQFTPIMAFHDSHGTTNEKYVANNVQAQFLIFVELLRGFSTISATSLVGHSERLANQYFMNRLYDYLATLSAKLGMENPMVGQRRMGGNGGTPMAGSSSFEGASSGNASTPMTPVSSMDDFMSA